MFLEISSLSWRGVLGSPIVCENGTICSFSVFSLSFMVFVASELDIFHLKAILESKGQIVNSGRQDLKQPKRTQNEGKHNKTEIGLQGLASNRKNNIKQGNKFQKDKWFHFHAATGSMSRVSRER